jgi:hypothetical protein
MPSSVFPALVKRQDIAVLAPVTTRLVMSKGILQFPKVIHGVDPIARQMASNAQNTADEALENSQITADKISSVNADLQAEVTRAETAETALQCVKADVSALPAETSARQSADETLQNEITA